MTDCSFDVRPYSRAAITTSATAFRLFEESSQALTASVRRLVGTLPATGYVRDTIRKLNNYTDNAVPALGDLSRAVMDEATDPPLDNDSDLEDDY
jgi:hypothetical protein